MSHEGLEAALSRCSLHALLLITSKVLAQAGYGDIEVLDRRQRRQKSRFGGHELLCQTTFGLFPSKVIVKVIQDDIRVRMVDELVGAITRTKADAGIIVSPGRLTARAKENLERYGHITIHAIEGDQLASLLATYHIGLRSRGSVDYAFFGELEHVATSFISSANSLAYA